MELPPLPLVKSSVDGSLSFLVDNSTLEKLVCPRLYELGGLRQLELVDARAGRNFGAGLHVGWRSRYVTCGSNAVDATSETIINDAMAEYFQSKPQPPDDFRTLEHAQRVMAVYNARYRNEPFTILSNAKGEPAIESSFAFEIGRVPIPLGPEVRIVYTGRVDLFTHDNDGEWAGPDHKTAFEFGQGFLDMMATDSGQKGYCWAFSQFYGHPPKGYIIDAVRIRRPGRAAKYTDAAPCDDSDFQRIPHYVFPDELDEWRDDVLSKCEMIFWMHARGYFQRHTKMCRTKFGRCDMFDVCISARNSRESIVSSNMYEKSTWSPLNPTH